MDPLQTQATPEQASSEPIPHRTGPAALEEAARHREAFDASGETAPKEAFFQHDPEQVNILQRVKGVWDQLWGAKPDPNLDLTENLLAYRRSVERASTPYHSAIKAMIEEMGTAGDLMHKGQPGEAALSGGAFTSESLRTKTPAEAFKAGQNYVTHLQDEPPATEKDERGLDFGQPLLAAASIINQTLGLPEHASVEDWRGLLTGMTEEEQINYLHSKGLSDESTAGIMTAIGFGGILAGDPVNWMGGGGARDPRLLKKALQNFSLTPEVEQAMITNAMKQISETGGATASPLGLTYKRGFATGAGESVQIPIEAFSEQDLRSFIEQRRKLFETGHFNLGAWTTTAKDGRTVIELDTSAVLPTLTQARRLGLHQGQEAIRDLHTGQDITIGERGERGSIESAVSALQATQGRVKELAGVSGAKVLDGANFTETLAALKEVDPHITRAEAKQIHRDSKEFVDELKTRLQPNFKVSTVGDKTMEIYRLGKDGQDWYSGVSSYLKETFGKDADPFARIFAVTSPNTAPYANLKQIEAGTYGNSNIENAARVYIAWKTGDQAVLDKFKVQYSGLEKALESMDSGAPFGDHKVWNYYLAVSGSDQAVVLDTHMFKAFGFKTDNATKGYLFGSDLAYAVLENFVRHKAAEAGVSPAQYQAGVWFGSKLLQGDKLKSEVFEYLTGRGINPNEISANLRDMMEQALTQPAKPMKVAVAGKERPEGAFKQPPGEGVQPEYQTGKRGGPELRAELEGQSDLFRGGAPSNMPEGKTAADVIEYERKELRNKIRVEKDVDPSKFSSKGLQWLSETEDYASEFGNARSRGKKSDFIILARDPDRGVLVAKKPFDYTAEANKPESTEAMTTVTGRPYERPSTFTPADDAMARLYDVAPVKDERAVPAWNALKAETERLYNDIVKKVKVERVTGQPYATAEEMNADIKRGVFKVTTDNSEHPVWNAEDNFKFRVVHDYLGHFETGLDFSLDGERTAFQKHAKLLTNEDAKQALKVEVYGQAAAALGHGGEFQVRKIFLPKDEALWAKANLPRQENLPGGGRFIHEEFANLQDAERAHLESVTGMRDPDLESVRIQRADQQAAEDMATQGNRYDPEAIRTQLHDQEAANFANEPRSTSAQSSQEANRIQLSDQHAADIESVRAQFLGLDDAGKANVFLLQQIAQASVGFLAGATLGDEENTLRNGLIGMGLGAILSPALLKQVVEVWRGTKTSGMAPEERAHYLQMAQQATKTAKLDPAELVARMRARLEEMQVSDVVHEGQDPMAPYVQHADDEVRRLAQEGISSGKYSKQWIRDVSPNTPLNDIESDALSLIMAEEFGTIQQLVKVAHDTMNPAKLDEAIERLVDYGLNMEPSRLSAISAAARSQRRLGVVTAGDPTSPGILHEYLTQASLALRDLRAGVPPTQIGEMIHLSPTPEHLATFSKNVTRPGFGDVAHQLWLQLLLGPITHVGNTLGNVGAIGYALGSRATAEMLGKHVRRGETMEMIRGYGQTWRDLLETNLPNAHLGLIDTFQDVLRIGGRFIEEQKAATKIDFKGHEQPNYLTMESLSNLKLVGPLLQKLGPYGYLVDYTGGVINAMGGGGLMASDKIFGAAAYNAEIRALALRHAEQEIESLALNEADALTAYAKYFNQYRSHPPHSAVEDAQRFREWTTFTGALTGQHEAALATMRNTSLGKWIVPFLGAIMKLGQFQMHHTPMPAMQISSLWFPKYREAILAGGADAEIAHAQMLFGTTTMAAAASWYTMGYLTGSGPDNPEDKKRMADGGWKPHAFNVSAIKRRAGFSDPNPQVWRPGDVLVPLDRYQPAGFIIGAGASIAEAAEHGIDTMDAVLHSAGSMMSLIGKQPFMIGMMNVANAVNDPDRYFESNIKRYMPSLMPVLSAQVVGIATKGVDPYVKNVQTVLDGMLAKVPGASKYVENQTDIWGHDVQSSRFSSEWKHDKALLALVENQVHVGQPSPLWNGVDIRDKDKYGDVYYQYKQLAGHSDLGTGQTVKQAIEEAISDSDWKDLNIDERATMLQAIFRSYRDGAKAEILENPKNAKLADDVERATAESKKRFNPLHPNQYSNVGVQ